MNSHLIKLLRNEHRKHKQFYPSDTEFLQMLEDAANELENLLQTDIVQNDVLSNFGIDFNEVTVVALVGLVVGASKEVMSGDKWHFIFGHAETLMKQAGYSEEDIHPVMERLHKFIFQRVRSNPMSGMF